MLIASLGWLSAIAVAGPPKNVSVCHWDTKSGAYEELSLKAKDAQKHLDKHGDLPAGQYYADDDGDGFGDASGEPVACPAPGYVDNADDCDDTDAVFAEVCSCLCFDAEDLREAWAYWRQSEGAEGHAAVWYSDYYATPEPDDSFNLILTSYEIWADGDVAAYDGSMFFAGRHPNTTSYECGPNLVTNTGRQWGISPEQAHECMDLIEDSLALESLP